jgi:hypothetical protein
MGANAGRNTKVYQTSQDYSFKSPSSNSETKRNPFAYEGARLSVKKELGRRFSKFKYSSLKFTKNITFLGVVKVIVFSYMCYQSYRIFLYIGEEGVRVSSLGLKHSSKFSKTLGFEHQFNKMLVDIQKRNKEQEEQEEKEEDSKKQSS